MPSVCPPAPAVRALDALHRHQRTRGQPPICARLWSTRRLSWCQLKRRQPACTHLRLSVSVCVRQHCRRKRHQCPVYALQRHPCALRCFCITISGQEVSRLSAPVCGSTLRLSVFVCGLARRVRWRKRHQCPASTLQRHPLSACVRLMLCIAISGQEVSRQPAPVCGSACCMAGGIAPQ